MAVLPDGRVVVGGAKGTNGVRNPMFAVARLAANGALFVAGAVDGASEVSVARIIP